MRFTFYTEKTVPQSLSALNARLQAKATSTRPELDGWIDRGGDFSLHLSAPVVGKFRRTTRLSGHIERQPGATVIRGSVASGSGPRERAAALGALAVFAVVLAVIGSPLLGLLLIPVGFWLYIPQAGDYVNAPVLLGELQRTLKAKPTLPKTARAATTPAKPVSTASRPPTANAKPAAKTAPKAAASSTTSRSASGSRPAPKPTPAPARSILDGEEEPGADRVPFNDEGQPTLF